MWTFDDLNNLPLLRNAPSPEVPARPQEGEVEGVIGAGDVLDPVGDFETLLEAIDAVAIYIDVHTDAFPTGQIRGQLND